MIMHESNSVQSLQDYSPSSPDKIGRPIFLTFKLCLLNHLRRQGDSRTNTLYEDYQKYG